MTMALNQRQIDIINQLYQANLTLARGTDDDRRTLTKKIAEQLVYEFGTRWGCKSSSPNGPISKDTIAYDNQDGSIDLWDWQNGTTREPQVHVGQAADYPNSKPSQGAYFAAVLPINHLEEQPPDNGDEGGEIPIGEILKPLLDKIDELNTKLDALTVQVKTLNEKGITARIRWS